MTAVEQRAESGFARILLAPSASADGVGHVLVLEPMARQLPPPRTRSATPGGPAGRGGDDRAIDQPRRSSQVRRPVNPFFIALTLLLALGLNLLPLGRYPAQPDVLALVLVFWNVHQPRRVGVGVAFVFGLLMDVREARCWAALGLRAAELRRDRRAPPARCRSAWPSRRCRCCRCFLAAHLVSLIVRMLAGGMFPGWELLSRRCSKPLLLASFVTGIAAGRAAPPARPGPESAPSR